MTLHSLRKELSTRTAEQAELEGAPDDEAKPGNTALAAERMVTAAGLTRRQGYWFQQASAAPIFISHHQRISHVLTTMEWFNAHLVSAGCRSDDPVAMIRQAADLFGEGFMWFDESLNMVAVNMAAARHFDLDRDLAKGRQLVELIPAMQDALVYGKLRLSLRDGAVHCADTPSIVRPGAWVHFETFPFRGGVACTFRIITDEVEATRSADIKGAILNAMTAHGGVGYVRLNTRMTIDRVNRSFADMVLISGERLAGVNFLDLVGRGGRVELRAWIERLFARQDAGAIEFQLLSNDGSLIDVHAGGSDLRGHYASEGAVVVVSRN